MRKIVKILIVVILILLASVAAFVIYQYEQPSSTNVMKGDHNILLLTADPSEKRPGVGGVDMAFVIHVTDGDIKNLTPIYPGGMTHPTAQEPAAANAGSGNLRFHDLLWNVHIPTDVVIVTTDAVDAGSGNLRFHDLLWNVHIPTDVVIVTTDAVDAGSGNLRFHDLLWNVHIPTDVVIVTTDAVDAVLNFIGPINIPGYNGNGTNAAVEYIRNETEQANSTVSRGNATETLMKPVMEAAKDPTKAPALFSAIISQY